MTDLTEQMRDLRNSACAAEEQRDDLESELAATKAKLAELEARIACGMTPEEYESARKRLYEQACQFERERDEARAKLAEVERELDEALAERDEQMQRAESAELGCEIAYRREPTQEEGDAHEYKHDQSMGASHGSGECFVTMGGWTGRRCRVCNRWVWGGPTACERCVAQEQRDSALKQLSAALARAWEEGAEAAFDAQDPGPDSDYIRPLFGRALDEFYASNPYRGREKTPQRR